MKHRITYFSLFLSLVIGLLIGIFHYSLLVQVLFYLLFFILVIFSYRFYLLIEKMGRTCITQVLPIFHIILLILR